MASLNDTLTVGLILVLLFGAVSLYLYTCIQQCEQKLNLVESILLDIKMSAELREYPIVPQQQQQQKQQQQQQQQQQQRPSSPPRSSVKSGVEVNDEDLYKSALEEAHLEELVSPLPASDSEGSDSTSSDSAPVATQSLPVSKSVPSINYESMTLAELKALAKQRSISGVSSMKRSQILEALRTSDKPSIGGGLSPFLDSVGGLDGEALDGVESLAAN